MWLLTPVFIILALLLIILGWDDWRNEQPGDWQARYFSGYLPFCYVVGLFCLGFMAGQPARAAAQRTEREAKAKAAYEHATYVRAMERTAGQPDH